MNAGRMRQVRWSVCYVMVYSVLGPIPLTGESCDTGEAFARLGHTRLGERLQYHVCRHTCAVYSIVCLATMFFNHVYHVYTETLAWIGWFYSVDCFDNNRIHNLKDV
jgi:hypothetical protein